MIYLKSKEEITRLILEILKDNPDSIWKNKKVDDVMMAWWYTGRTGEGMRLTIDGCDAFEQANLSYYEYPFSPPVNTSSKDEWHKYLRLINKKVRCPFYLGVYKQQSPYIKVFDSKIAMLIALYGNLQEYIGSVR